MPVGDKRTQIRQRVKRRSVKPPERWHSPAVTSSSALFLLNELTGNKIACASAMRQVFHEEDRLACRFGAEFVFPHGTVAAYHRADGPALHLHAVIGRPAAF